MSDKRAYSPLAKGLVDRVKFGDTIEDALTHLNIATPTYKTWLSRMESFREELEKAERFAGKNKEPPGDFISWRKKYFGTDTPAHQREWVAHIEYCPVKYHMFITSPEAGKTSLFGVEYPAYLFAYESWKKSIGEEYRPERIAYISNSAEFAADVGWQLKKTLTDKANHLELIEGWGPFQDTARGSEWSKRAIYMRWRDASEKEPSIQWLGRSTNAQGKRLTLAILDDIDTAQMGPTERQTMLRTFYRVTLQRLGTEGRLIVIGNRQDEADIYSHFLEKAEDAGWHVLVQKATDDQGHSFWPERFSDEYLAQKRAAVGDREWNLVYQQTPSLGDAAMFPHEVLESMKRPGLGLGEKFPDGITIAGLDPAPDGGWACAVVSYSRSRQIMRLLDLKAGVGGGYDAMKDAVRWATAYRPHYFGIEAQGQNALVLSENIREIISSSHAQRIEMPTTKQGILDSYYGLSAMGTWAREGRVEIPWDSEARSTMRPLFDELSAFRFDSKENGRYRGAKDRVMSMWFCFRTVLTHGRGSNVVPFGSARKQYPWLSRQQRSVPV